MGTSRLASSALLLRGSGSAGLGQAHAGVGWWHHHPSQKCLLHSHPGLFQSRPDRWTVGHLAWAAQGGWGAGHWGTGASPALGYKILLALMGGPQWSGFQLKQPMSSEVKQARCLHCLTELQVSCSIQEQRWIFAHEAERFCLQQAQWRQHEMPPGTSKLSVHAHN